MCIIAVITLALRDIYNQSKNMHYKYYSLFIISYYCIMPKHIHIHIYLYIYYICIILII